jgi:phosphoglycerate dehydrogenase-like enzyme
MVAERLRHLPVEILAYDPVVPPAVAGQLGVRLCGLDEAFRRADVVSCHLPLLPATAGVIRGPHFAAMKPGAIFINTARGDVVAEAEMTAELQRRADLTALLDVIQDERPGATSPLFSLPNVWVTPHLAGSLGREQQMLGRLVADEVARYTAGQPLQHELTPETFATSA